MSSPRRTYNMREVERLLQLPARSVRSMVDAGLISPARGPRRQLQFSFRDLATMRSARDLLKGKLPPRRRTELFRQLSAASAFTSASTEGIALRASDQLSLPFASEPSKNVVFLKADTATVLAEDWFDRAIAIEECNPAAACTLYERATAHDSACAHAWINWGRLLHALGEFDAAERVYQKGLEQCSAEPWLHFNLALVREDLVKTQAAIDSYLSAIALDPRFADAHFNVSRLYYATAQKSLALRHLSRYRALLRT